MTDIDTNHKSSNNGSNADDDDNDERLQNIIVCVVSLSAGVFQSLLKKHFQK